MLQLASSARSAEGAIRSMSQTEAVAAGKKYQYNLSLLKRLEARGGPGGAGMAQASAEEINALAETGLTPGVSFTAPFNEKTGKYGAGFYDPTMVQSAIQRTQQLGGEARARVEALNRPSPSVQLETLDLSGGEGAGAGKGGKGAKERRDMSLDELAIRSRIREQEAGIEQGIEGYNKLKLIQLNLELELLQIREKQANQEIKQNEALNQAQEAMRKADSERIAIFKDMSKAVYEGVEETAEQEERRRNLAIDYRDLMNEVRFANGEITAREYEQNQALAERERIIKRIYEMVGGGAITPEQGQVAVQQVETAALPGTLEAAMRDLRRELEQMTSIQTLVIDSAQGIGDAFGESFNSIITGASSARESLANFFSNVGKMFADMATRMISQWLVMKTIGLIGNLFPGATSPMLRSSGGAAMTAGQTTEAGFNMGASLAQGFANGGIVTGPTLGLVGEGRYNEAIVPLPDGKSIPVELGGDAKNIVSNITVNVSNGQARSEGNGGANDLGRKLEGAVKQVIIEELRPGGVLAGKR
jgi:hypothetical protein